ncbi:MAG TPA: filamentous hemagglutinin N-terminal domain-containing protein, partial [Devosia sp.]|nr:filamentous hemagglutinin N-terminal domain-containing protein [Devosia sp.]
MRWLQSFQLLLLIGSVSGAPAWAQELPSGASVGSGLVDIATPTPGAMTINQGSPSAIVNWQGFSIGAGGSVSVVQPNAQSVMLNRVTGTATSNIAGQLNANGQVYLVNPNGIAITSSGAVNAAGFVASTLGISDSDFLAGDYRFAGDGASAGVSNAGRIDIGPGGYAALLGGRVDNSGVISAPLGKIGLGAGERVTLDLSGDGFLQVTMPSQDGGTDALISNSGTISADGGRVEISVAAAQNAARHVINLSGVVEARSVSGRSGAIVLGGSGGAVRVSGRLDTSARTPAPHPATGGVITITGAAIGLEGATLDASGLDGGGAVRIGGDYYGAGILPTAATLSVDDTSIIYADALEDGDGGGVVLWSNELTSFAGNISAKGAGAGQGGFVEVSGKHLLDYRGFADLRAASGRFGTLLLDPYNIIISAAPTSNNSGVPGYGPTGDDSNINATDLAGQLGSANVTTSTAGAGAQAGNITVSAPVIWAAPTTLTLDADNTISIFNTISSGSFGGGLTLQAGGNIVLGPIDPSTALGLQAGGLFSATAGGSISGGTASAPTSITSFNDNVVLQAGGAINLVGSLSSLGGDTTATAGAALTLEGNASASNTLQLVATGSVSLLGTGHSLSSNTGLVVVSGSSFQNTGGYTVSTPFEGGRFVIYSTNWAADNNGGLTGSHLYGRTFALNPPASLG